MNGIGWLLCVYLLIYGLEIVGVWICGMRLGLGLGLGLREDMDLYLYLYPYPWEMDMACGSNLGILISRRIMMIGLNE